MTIVLANGYKEIVITDIIAPLRGGHNITTFDEAVKKNYTSKTPNPVKRQLVLQFVNSVQGKESNRYLENFLQDPIWLQDGVREACSSQFENSIRGALNHTIASNLTKTSMTSLSKILSLLMVSWMEWDKTLMINGTEYEFLKCNKTILVDNNEDRMTGQNWSTQFIQINQNL